MWISELQQMRYDIIQTIIQIRGDNYCLKTSLHDAEKVMDWILYGKPKGKFLYAEINDDLSDEQFTVLKTKFNNLLDNGI